VCGREQEAIVSDFSVSLEKCGVDEQPSVSLPAKRPLTPEIISRLGPHRKGIVAGFGIFKNTGVFPEDSLEYQLEVRAEWD
jgi:hypothetical protein